MKGNIPTPPRRWRTRWTPIRCASTFRRRTAAPGWRQAGGVGAGWGAYPDRAFPRRHYRYRPDDRQIPHRAGAGDVDQPWRLLKAGMYAGIRVTQQQRGGADGAGNGATYTAYGDTVFLAQQVKRHDGQARFGHRG
ncbi:hypothetical protein M8494_15765 [Serratia ureilytica]